MSDKLARIILGFVDVSLATLVWLLLVTQDTDKHTTLWVVALFITLQIGFIGVGEGMWKYLNSERKS